MKNRKGYSVCGQQKNGQAKVCIKVTLSGGTKAKQIVVGSVPPEETEFVTTQLRMFLDEAWVPTYREAGLDADSRKEMDSFIMEIRDQLRAISADAGYAGKNRST